MPVSLFSLRTNLSALGTSRNFTAHYVSLADSVRRLSTGLRVERAADDAAGLAIRELMRADVASLHQGARNVDDAISLIQTADGALGVIDEKLIRMKELAEQAATGTYDSTQRLMIDSEFQQMASEIERIARATDFNGIHLLDGSLSGPHDGSQMEATGALKIHFGTGNDSAEDYYYIQIGDATLAGLGLMDTVEDTDLEQDAGETTTGNAVAPGTWEGTLADSGMEIPPLNDRESSVVQNVRQTDALSNMQDILPQQGVHIDICHSAEVREQLVPGSGQRVHLRSRIFDGTLVLLDIYDLRLRGHVMTALAVLHHALVVDGTHLGHHDIPQSAQRKSLYRTYRLRARLLGIPVIGYDRTGRTVPLLAYLFVRLVDREIELREQRLILPLAPLPVVVGELRVLRHQEDKDEEYDSQRNNPGDDVSFHGTAI